MNSIRVWGAAMVAAVLAGQSFAVNPAAANGAATDAVTANAPATEAAATDAVAANAAATEAAATDAAAADAAAPIAVAPIAAAAAFDLVTQREATAWNTAAPKESQDFSTHDLREDGGITNCHSASNNDADNPRIRILAPPLGRPLNSPLDIELRFIPTISAPIRPESFRACYVGTHIMDITKRITDHARVSEHGLHVTGARLPQGRHHLLLLIADQRGRLGRQEVQLDIE